MRKKKTAPVSDDSEESNSASSDSTIPNTNSKKKRKRGRPAKKQTARKSRALDDSDSDTSPQPGPSGLNNHNSINSESESESADSDYGPVRAVTDRRKRKPLGKADKAKKQKAHNKSVNGVSSNKRTENGSQVNTFKKKATPNGVEFNANDVESLAQKLVYLLLVEDQKKYAIKRKSITTHVFKDEKCTPKLYKVVLIKANSILKKIYGMELMEIQDQKDSYLIINKLDKGLGIHDYVEVSKLKQQQHGLILYLITVIYMNENAITEEELTKCLQPLGIDLTSNKLHPIFGDVKKYITSELVKQMYLSYEVISKEPLKHEIKWGTRAMQEFDKRELLRFACQIVGNKPEDWRMQFKDAEESANPEVNGDS